MSKKPIRTWCLVIDASIAEAAGTRGSPHPTAARCRDFLLAVRNVCHRMAWSEAIVAEWNEHQRGFATQWLVSMRNLRKLRPVEGERQEEMRQAIEEHSKDPQVIEKMLKDVHLFEAALATDLRLASLDDNSRGHFSRLAKTVRSLGPIMWANPSVEGDQAVAWLEKGAPKQSSRRLRA